MTRQEKIEDLQDKVSKNYIIDYGDLIVACEKEDIDPYEVLSPMEYNACDSCGGLTPSDDLLWLEYLTDEEDKEFLEKAYAENEDYCALCWGCVNRIKRGEE